MRRVGRGETMKVGDLFTVYKKRLRAPQGTIIQSFIDVIQSEFAITLTSTQCSYSVHTRILKLNIPGMVKSEILLQKKKILDLLRVRIGEKGCPIDIM